MAEITQKTEILLDRLYNLKGEDNIIIGELLSQIIDTEREIGFTDEAKKANELNKVNCEGKLELFLTQKSAFEETFQGLGNDTFAELSNIGVELAVGDILANISDRSPAYCEGLKNEINNYQNNIDDAVLKRGNLTATLVTLENRKSKAETDREQLIGLLEQSLSNDEIERESLTAHYVKKILSSFETFSEEELTKLTKLIMFPDEGLYQFDQTYEERLAKGLIGLTEEPEEIEEEATIEESEEEYYENTYESEDITPIPDEESHYEPEEENPADEEPITIEMSSDETSEEQDEETDSEETSIIPIIPIVEEDEEESEPVIVLESNSEEEQEIEENTYEKENVVQEESREENLNDFEHFLIDNNININKFTEMNDLDKEEIYSKLENIDRNIIATNFETLRSIDAEEESYKYTNGYMYLADEELVSKINLLRIKGVSEYKIKELLGKTDNGLKESYENLSSRIKSIENLHRNIDESNIDLINCDVVRYEQNLQMLSDSGYELDEKEIRNHNHLFFESKNFYDDVSVLKDYLISIVKTNGKYALSVFWKTGTELMEDIDCLIENDLEDMISNHPETLGLNAGEILKRVKYCEMKGEPIYEGNGRSEFCKYITSYPEFYSRYGLNPELPELIDKANVNDLLPNIIGNEEYSKMIIDILNKSYKSNSAIEVALEDNLEGKFTKLRTSFEDKFGAKVVGKYTYKLNDLCISKNKFERNLAIILNALFKNDQPTEYIENEIILAAALYNLQQEAQILKATVQKCTDANNVLN